MIQFGVAGNPDDFYNQKLKKSEDMPKYLSEYGLDAYEYQCTRGVRISDEKARFIKEQSEKYDITLSIHAPYYISLSNPNEDIRRKSIQYIVDTATAAKKMGADRIVVHAGALLKFTREEAMEHAKKTIVLAQKALDEQGLQDITICPETMGKINQLGNSEEIISFCLLEKRFIPTIDFGHLYCRTLGKLVSKEDWIEELSKYIDALGYDRMKHFHSHFSKIEYSDGGEKRHVNFEQEEVGPFFEEVAKAFITLNLEPRIISESAGHQSKDAKTMKEIYMKLKHEVGK